MNKKFKGFITVLVMFILVGALTITLTACGDGGGTPDPRAAYYGTYKSSSQELTIEANRLKHTINTSHYTLINLTWELITNTNDYSKTDFPTGYKITGTVESQNYSQIYPSFGTVGEQWTDAWYLHKDGDEIRWSSWSNNYEIVNQVAIIYRQK